MTNESKPQYRDMTIDDLAAFFHDNPEADEHTWVNGNKVRFSDVIRRAQREIATASRTSSTREPANFATR